MTPSSGCKPSCETWSYDTVLDDYSYDRTSMFSNLGHVAVDHILALLRCQVQHFDALDRQFRPPLVQRSDRAAHHHGLHGVQGL